MKWNGRNYRPVLGVGKRSAQPQTYQIGGRKMKLQQMFFIGPAGGEEPVPSPTPTPSTTPQPTPTPTPSATPAPQFYILAENSDILQAENGDLLVLEAAP